MTMVYVTLHSQNFNIILLTYLLDKLLKSCFHARMIVYFSPIPWAKNKMISYHRYCRCCTSIIIFHVSIITYIRKIGNRKIRLSSQSLCIGLSQRYFVIKQACSERRCRLFYVEKSPQKATRILDKRAILYRNGA